MTDMRKHGKNIISSSAGSVNSETAFMIKTDTERAKEAIMWKKQ